MKNFFVMWRDNPMFALHAALGIVFSLCGAPFGASKINTRAAFTLSQEPYVYGKLWARSAKRVFCARIDL